MRVRALRVSPSHLDAVLAVDLLELAADVRGAVRGVVLDYDDLPIEFAGGAWCGVVARCALVGCVERVESV